MMKIAISVHGRFHAFDLARGLHRRGMLDCLQTTYPAYLAKRFIDPGVAIHSAPGLEIWRRLYPKIKLGPQPDLAIAQSFGRFAARSLKTSRADLLVGWSSATLEAIAPAQAAGMKVIIERGSTHIVDQTDVLREEYRRHGKKFTETDTGIIERELREYEMADAISVPSKFAARSFINKGIAEDKLIVNPLGVDPDRFRPARDSRVKRIPRILFVGSIGVRKGIPLLLHAFSRLKGKAELHLVGPIETTFASDLGNLPLDNVTIPGPASGEALLRQYEQADIFCLPSLEEGFGMVVLEAMASGVPVVLSDVTGASDVVTPGQDGLIFQSGNEAALANALETLIDAPETRHAMGTVARKNVLAAYRWDDYVDRALVAYKKLLA